MIFLLALALIQGCQGEKYRTFLFVGCYTDGVKGEGITVFEMDEASGELTEVEKEGDLINSTFLTLSPNGKYLYACTDTKLETNGSVTAFSIDTLSGKITPLNKLSTSGRNPVHVVTDPSGKMVVASGYGDAVLDVFHTNGDGSLNFRLQGIHYWGGSQVIPDRQEEAHLHSATFSPDGGLIFVPDLGADRIRALTVDSVSGFKWADTLTAHTVSGSGPRHFVFHPNGDFAYCIEELSGTVSAWKYQKGHLLPLGRYPSYQTRQEVYGSADIHISAEGKFLYTSNRQEENSIAVFAVNPASGALTLQNHQSTLGKIPRSFVLDPSGQFLIVGNQMSDNLVVFRRYPQTGLLTPTGIEVSIHAPASLKMRRYRVP